MPQKLIQHSLGFSRETRMDSIMRTSKTLMFGARTKNQHISNLLEFERKRIDSDEHLVLVHTNKSIDTERDCLSKMLAMRKIYQRHSFEKYDPVLHPQKRNRYCHLDARDLMKIWFKGKTVSIAKTESDIHSKTDSRSASSIFHRLRMASGGRSRKMSSVSGEGDLRGKLLTETIHEENRSDVDSLYGGEYEDFEEVVHRLDDDGIHDYAIHTTKVNETITTVQQDTMESKNTITPNDGQIDCKSNENIGNKSDIEPDASMHKNTENRNKTEVNPNDGERNNQNGGQMLLDSTSKDNCDIGSDSKEQSNLGKEQVQDKTTEAMESDQSKLDNMNCENRTISSDTEMDKGKHENVSEVNEKCTTNEITKPKTKTNILDENVSENIETKAIYISSPASHVNSQSVVDQKIIENKIENHDNKPTNNEEDQQNDHKIVNHKYSATDRKSQNETSVKIESGLIEKQTSNTNLNKSVIPITPAASNIPNTTDLQQNSGTEGELNLEKVENVKQSPDPSEKYTDNHRNDKSRDVLNSGKRFVQSSTERNNKIEREKSNLSSKSRVISKPRNNQSNEGLNKTQSPKRTQSSNQLHRGHANTNKEAKIVESGRKTQTIHTDRLLSREKTNISSKSSQIVNSRGTSHSALRKTEPQPTRKTESMRPANDTIAKHKTNLVLSTTAPGILRRTKTDHESMLGQNETRRSSSASSLKFDRTIIRNAATNNPVNWKGLIHKLRGQKTESIVDDRVVEAKSTRRLKRREKTFVLSRERTIFPGECKSTFQMRKFIEREVSDLMFSLSPKGKRQTQIELLKERESMKLPLLVDSSKSTSSILRDFRKYRGNGRTFTAP